ncbi:MAG: fibronectin type III domain-containing protein [bacterium]
MQRTQPTGRLNRFSALTLTSLLVVAGLFVIPLLAPNVSAAPPVVAKQWYQDLDCNGHVDAVTIVFNDPLGTAVAMKDDSIRPSDFTLTYALGTGTISIPANGFMTTAPVPGSGYPAAGCVAGVTAGLPSSPGTNQPTAANGCPAGAGIDDSCFTLLFPEGLNPDGGPTNNGGTAYNPPAITYNPDAAAPAHTVAGINLASLGACASGTCRFDATAPTLRAAYAKTGDSTITVLFSENVGVGANAGTVPAATDFCVTGAAQLAGSPPVSVPSGSLPNRGFKLTLTAPIANPAAVTVGVGSGTCTSNIVDTAGNIVPGRTVTTGAPFVNRVYASAGDATLVIEFNGPVWDGTTDITQIQSTFEVITGSGSGLTGLQSTGFHTSGSDRVQVSAQGSPPNKCDITQSATDCGSANAGTRIRIAANKIFGFKATGIPEQPTGTPVGPCVFTNTAEDFCLNDPVNVPTPPAGVSGSITAPRVVQFMTEDTNQNGCLDTIKVTWNEKMDDSTIGGTGWRVFFPNEVVQTLPTMQSLEPTTGAGAANDQYTYLNFLAGETCTGSTPSPYGNTGVLPRVSFCDGIDVSRSGACLTSTKDFSGLLNTGSQMVAGNNMALKNYIYRAPTVDGAKPVIVAASTRDTAPNDGYLDAIKIQFSEGIDATTVDATQWTAVIPAWTVAARCPRAVGFTYSVTSVTTTNSNPQTQPALPTLGTLAGDVILNLAATPVTNPVGDSGCVPDVTYTGGAKFVKESSATPGGLLANNVPADTSIGVCAADGTLGGNGNTFTNNKLCENDGAPPVIIPSLTLGTVGSDTAYVTMSEPVFGSGGGAPPATCGTPAAGGTWAASQGFLRASDFDYQDNSNGGATGIAGVSSISSDCRKWQITLNVPNGGGLSSSDQLADCIQSRIPTSSAQEGIRDAVPAAPWVSPPATPTGIGNVGYPTDGATIPCVKFTTGPSPVSGAVTMDSDRDGSLDAIQVTFTSSVKDIVTNAATPAFVAAACPGDADCGAAFKAISGSLVCRVDVLPTAAGTVGPEDRFYAHVGGTCTATVADGDFRYSGMPGTAAINKKAGTPVVCVGTADADCGNTLTGVTGGTLRRVGGPGSGGAPTATDLLYNDVGGSSTTNVENGDFRLSGADSRAWSVTFPSGVAIVSGVSSGQATGPGTHSNTFGTAPTGAACHDSTILTANVANDNILYICFEELRDAAGKLIPNTGAVPTFSYMGSTLLDSTGGVIGVFNNQATVDGAQPVLVSAFVGTVATGALPILGAQPKTITATFSEPVTETGGNALLVSDFAYTNGNAGAANTNCPSGAASLASLVSGGTAPTGTLSQTHTVVLTTDGPITTFDVGPNPVTGVFLAGGGTCLTVFDSVRAISGQVVEKAAPHATVYTPASALRLTDAEAPSIASAGFIDANGDGIIDAVQVKFNEMVNDAPLTAADWSVKIGTQALTIKAVTTGQDGTETVDGPGVCQNTYSLATGTGAVKTVFALYPDEVTPATGFGKGLFDDTIFLCLNPDAATANGGTKTLGTGATGSLLYSAAAPASRITDVQMATNKLQDLAAAVTIADLARPVILNNCRVGSVQAGATCPADVSDVSVETVDLNSNGKIDALKVTFSEKVKDSTFTVGQWNLAARALTGMQSGSIVPTPAGEVDDATIYLTFAEASSLDSGTGRYGSATIPDVAYFGSGSMKDLNNNLLRGVSPGACNAPTVGCSDERDGAAPTIVSITAAPGTNLVTIQFSENVGTGATGTGAIGTADLAYVNTASGGASSINSISHAVGSSTLTLTLNANLNSADVASGGDKIVFTPGNIKEFNCGAHTPPYAYPIVGPAAPNSCYREIAITQSSVELAGVKSHAPPTAPVLTKDPTGDTATGAKFTWTVPTTSGGATLASYEFFVCQAPTLPASHAGCVAPTGGQPAASATSLTVTGLTTGSTYSFGIRAIDSDGLAGADSNGINGYVPAAPDTDPPCAITDLSVGTTTSNSVTLTFQSPFEDCAAHAGKVKSYKVAVSTGTAIGSQAQFDAAVATTGLSFSPATPQANPTLQGLTVSNLQPGQQYLISVEAVDDATPTANVGPLGAAVPATPSAPGGTPAKIVDLAVTAGSAFGSVDLSWSAPPKDSLLGTGTVTGYDVRITTSPGGLGVPVSSSDLSFGFGTPGAPGQPQSATISGLSADTTYYITVAGKNLGTTGTPSTPASITIGSDPNALTVAALTAFETSFANTLKVTNSGGTNTLTWDTPPGDATHAAEGIQIWKSTNGGPYTLVKTISSLSPEYGLKSMTDPGSSSDKYRGTVYYGNTAASGFAANGDPNSIPGFSSLHEASASSNFLGLDPMIWWIIIAAVGLLLLLLIILLIVRSRRNKGGDFAEEDDDGGFAAVDEGAEAAPAMEAPDAPPADAAADAAAASAAVAAAAETPPPAQPQASAEKHYLTCPKCTTEFTAMGVKPLAIQCPNCGVRGTLR